MILVTGANGFIGRHLCNFLYAMKEDVLEFDHHLANNFATKRNVMLGDVRDYTSVSEAIAKSTGVIHLAGVLGTQETIHEPEPAVQTNIFGSLNVFKACEHYDKRCVYIAVGNHWMNNSYSITKTTAERFAYMFNKERGTKIAVVRGLNAYGPGQKASPVKKIMPNFIISALAGHPITIYGDGQQIMDMIYVSDLARILYLALIKDHGVYDQAFEAGTGQRTSVLQIANTVLEAVHSREDITRDMLTYLPMRPGEPESSVVVANIATLIPLGIQPGTMTPLAQGVKETVHWYTTWKA